MKEFIHKHQDGVLIASAALLLGLIAIAFVVSGNVIIEGLGHVVGSTEPPGQGLDFNLDAAKKILIERGLLDA